MEPKVIYEDEYLMVVNKPSGWVVNRAITTGKNPVVQDWIENNFNYEIVKSAEYRSGIVHRLDKETSGVLIIAKTKKAFKELQEQFKNREVKKQYMALVHGDIDIDEAEINAPIGRLPWNRERFGILVGGRSATSKYKVVAKYQKGDSKYSLLLVYPKTGRTHQIRVHLKSIGHPVVSDQFYAGRKTSRKDRIWCPRLFLHAKKIEFKIPGSKKERIVEAELTKDLDSTLNKLERVNS
jgi:23S rRNA pseudouridine1911/1915/1917 synthase